MNVIPFASRYAPRSRFEHFTPSSFSRRWVADSSTVCVWGARVIVMVVVVVVVKTVVMMMTETMVMKWWWPW